MAFLIRLLFVVWLLITVTQVSPPPTQKVEALIRNSTNAIVHQLKGEEDAARISWKLFRLNLKSGESKFKRVK